MFSLLAILLCGSVCGLSPDIRLGSLGFNNMTPNFDQIESARDMDELFMDELIELTYLQDWEEFERIANQNIQLGSLGFNNMTQDSDQIEYASDIEKAVVEAADFLLQQRQADYGWGSPVSTSRAIVALSFTERVRHIPGREWQLMKKQLNIQLSLDLLPKPMTTSLTHMALYINALYATCQDPRSFQGLDLVEYLRAEAKAVMSSKFSLPIVFLTLCVVGEMDPRGVDIHQLPKIYASSDRISTQALALRAWDCMARRLGDHEYSDLYITSLNEFSSKLVNITDENLDVYSTALYFQAYNAAVYKSDMSMLMNHRQNDGSFGDLLATYYAIPALLNATLMQLSCSDTGKQESNENTFNIYSGGKSVTYSLWIPTDSYVNARTITVNYGDQDSFYDIMRMASYKDPTYRFMYGLEDGKKNIYSIADTPNDAETGKLWTLYQANGEVVVNSAGNLKEFKSDAGFSAVDEILPENGAHYIFWLKHRIPMI